MTEAALDVLSGMQDGTEFAYERGSGYLANRRVKNASKILIELIHAMAIRKVDTGMESMEIYRIGETGREILAAIAATTEPKP